MANASRSDYLVPMPRGLDPMPRVWDLFESLFSQESGGRSAAVHPVRIEETIEDGTLMVRAELPGIDPDDVEITVSNGRLTIQAEKKEQQADQRRSEFFYGKFARIVALPQGINEKDVEAHYRNGVLEVRVPLPSPDRQPQRIEIKRDDEKDDINTADEARYDGDSAQADQASTASEGSAATEGSAAPEGNTATQESGATQQGAATERSASTERNAATVGS